MSLFFCLFVGFFLSFFSKNMGRQLQAVFSALKNLAMPGKFNIYFFQQKAHLLDVRIIDVFISLTTLPIRDILKNDCKGDYFCVN